MTQFYVTLPSDSSTNYFPDNTVAHYKTKLAKRICTDGDYEVALTEIVYPLEINNFMPSEPLVALVDLPVELGGFRWQLESGNFKDVHALAMFLNAELSEKFKKAYPIKTLQEPIFKFYEDVKRIDFKFKGEFKPAEHLCLTFNWTPEEAGLQQGFMKFLEKPVELPQLHLMYIYSDIVGPSLVGDVQTPLLRVVALNRGGDGMITASFDKPYYLPVTRHDFDQIEILLNTELGTRMPFTNGKSLVVLHFRKRHESLLSNVTLG